MNINKLKLSDLTALFCEHILPNVRKTKVFPSWAKLKDLSPRKKQLLKDKSVLWDIAAESEPYADHIEMSGFYASAIVSYGKDKKGALRLMRHVTFPSIRFKPNNTSSMFSCNFEPKIELLLDGVEIKDEHVQTAQIKGALTLTSDFKGGATVVRTIYPATNFPALIEKIEVKNNTTAKVEFSARELTNRLTDKSKSVGRASVNLIDGKIEVGTRLVDANGDFRSANVSTVSKLLVSKATATCYFVHYAVRKGTVLNFNTEKELKERQKLVNASFNGLTLTDDHPYTDTLFAYTQLRGNESIFETKNGLIHSPGGGRYYSALWANDQLEYSNPFFPFASYKPATEQAVNCYKLCSAYALRGVAVPASLIIDCTVPSNVAGDRGDTEMYAYGQARFLLAYGDNALALSLWEAQKKAIEFCLKKKSADGVIYSDSDELENRFSAGSYNLNTNCLLYDALIHTARLAEALGEDGTYYKDEAEALKRAIYSYFRAKIEGFDTYRYHDGCNELRAWICTPIAMRLLDEGVNGTIDALFSDRLYNNATLKTTSSTATVWDRSLLYALRAAFIADKRELAADITEQYAKARLVGTHSPYPYEAYPEGNRRHLAAESVLFNRIVTEGMFGFDPVSFSELYIEPHTLAKLSNVYYFDTKFEVEATANNVALRIGTKTYYADGKKIFDFEKLCWK